MSFSFLACRKQILIAALIEFCKAKGYTVSKTTIYVLLHSKFSVNVNFVVVLAHLGSLHQISEAIFGVTLRKAKRPR